MDWDEFTAQIPDTKTIQVEAYAGAGARGAVYAAPADIEKCVIEHVRRLVKGQTQDAAGWVAISSTTVYCPPGTIAPELSRVTLPGGIPTKVLAWSNLDDHGVGLPSHVELMLE